MRPIASTHRSRDKVSGISGLHPGNRRPHRTTRRRLSLPATSEAGGGARASSERAVLDNTRGDRRGDPCGGMCMRSPVRTYLLGGRRRGQLALPYCGATDRMLWPVAITLLLRGRSHPTSSSTLPAAAEVSGGQKPPVRPHRRFLPYSSRSAKARIVTVAEVAIRGDPGGSAAACIRARPPALQGVLPTKSSGYRRVQHKCAAHPLGTGNKSIHQINQVLSGRRSQQNRPR